MLTKFFKLSSKSSSKIAISLSLATSLFFTAAMADVENVSDESLTMDKNLRFDMGRSLFNLRFGHISPKELNDDYSSRIFDSYLKTLDPSKVYFTQDDINQFEPYRFKLDDLIKRYNAEIAFTIFKRFRQRLSERTDHIMFLIDSDFDFEKNEYINIDRDSFEWSENKEAVEERWRKRIKNDVLQGLMAKTPVDEIRENLKRRYNRQRDVIYQLKSEEVFEWFMNSFTRDLGPHTTYMSHATAENFEISMSLQLTGIGAALSTDEDYTVVNRIMKGGPAEKSKAIKAEDKIVAVGQEGEEMVNVIGWRLMDVVQLIRGDKGSKVRLDILPAANAPGSPPEQLEFVRDLIQLEDQAAKLEQITINDNDQSHSYSVISIPSFYSNERQIKRNGGKLVSTSNDVKELLKQVKASESEGVILDLRGNGGGFLHEAIQLTGLFIDQGPVVQVVSKPNRRQVLRDRDAGVAYDGPVVVLIDRYSASASEIFAGALQDYGRALIIGERSFGKGTVQTPQPLRDETNKRKSQIKFTNAQFYRISGSSTQYKGVVPDFNLNAGKEDIEFGERSYDNALPWTQTVPAKYKAGSFSPTLVSKLRDSHQQRSNASPAFELLRKSSDNILKNREIKQLSLNLKERKSERDRREIESLDNLNAYRKSLGLETVTRETRKDNPLPGEDEHWNQVYHNEAANILHDFIKFSNMSLITKK